MSELLADDFHSFLPGKLAGMELVHPHLRIPMTQAVGAGGPSKAFHTGFGKDVGEGLSGRDVVMLLMIDSPISKSNRFRQTSKFKLFGQLSWNDHLAHQSALAFHRIDDASSPDKPIFRQFTVCAWYALRATFEGIELMSPQTCSTSDTCSKCCSSRQIRANEFNLVPCIRSRLFCEVSSTRVGRLDPWQQNFHFGCSA